MQNSTATTDDAYFKDANDRHGALAQLHRWWLIFEAENPEVHFDIFADDFVIDSANGAIQGLDAFKRRFLDFKGWQNAHHLKIVNIRTKSPNDIEMSVDLDNQNINPSGQKAVNSVHYDMLLERRPGQLPRFKMIKPQIRGTLADTTFVSAYAENRIASFVHYWLYLIETGQGDASAFRELLSENFTLDFGQEEAIKEWSGFAAWFQSIPGWLRHSAHFLSQNLRRENSPNAYTTELSFDWQGVSVDGHPMIAKSVHNWILLDQKGNRFAQMQDMKVRMIVPFQKIIC